MVLGNNANNQNNIRLMSPMLINSTSNSNITSGGGNAANNQQSFTPSSSLGSTSNMFMANHFLQNGNLNQYNFGAYLSGTNAGIATSPATTNPLGQFMHSAVNMNLGNTNIGNNSSSALSPPPSNIQNSNQTALSGSQNSLFEAMYGKTPFYNYYIEKILIELYNSSQLL